MASTVHIGLGSNLGDREGNLSNALCGLGRVDALEVVAVSSLYDTAPVGPPQGRYLNAVAELWCELSPAALLGVLQELERDLGRERDVRWGPRVIDLDILLWGERVVAEPHLQVPHLFLHQRRFALEPLAELAPDARHPVLGATVRELLGQLGSQDVVRHLSRTWPSPEARPPSP